MMSDSPFSEPYTTCASSMTQPPPSQYARLQRKRAARACDQCRRRKSRCDGQMNCSSCRTVGLQCSFGYQVKQTRGPAYVAHLERRIDDLEEKLRRANASDEINIEDQPSPTCTTSRQSTNDVSPIDSSRPPFSSLPSNQSFSSQSNQRASTSPKVNEEQPDHLIDTITTEPRGKPFGIDVLRQLCNHGNQISQLSACPVSSMRLVQALDNSQAVDAWSDSSTGNPFLPSKQIALQLINNAFSEAFHLWPFVDKAQVAATTYRLYNTNTFGQEQGDRDNLALVYALLALGQRFDMAGNVASNIRKAQGVPYFTAAREIVTLTNCDHSLVAIQTIICLALYLRACGALSKVHVYVSAAASAAVRLGLHEQVPYYPQDESALRQRTWSTIRSLDVYVSTSLGLPQIISMPNADAQEAFPSLSSGSNAELVAATAHAEVAGMLSRAIDNTYRSRNATRPMGFGSFAVPSAGLKETSEEFDAWYRNCPVMNQSEDNMTRSQLLLAYAYDYAQLLLYSPFVHHLASPTFNKSLPEYEYGMKCVGAAVHAVQLAERLQKQLQFNEAYFFNIDVLAFAAMVLLVAELGPSDHALFVDAMRAGRVAKELLLILSLHSPTAAECWSALAVRPATAEGIAMMRNGSIASSSFHNSGDSTKESSTFVSKRPAFPTIHQDSAVDVRVTAGGPAHIDLGGPDPQEMGGFDPPVAVANPIELSWSAEHIAG